jgi:hypothetical protein
MTIQKNDLDSIFDFIYDNSCYSNVTNYSRKDIEDRIIKFYKFYEDLRLEKIQELLSKLFSVGFRYEFVKNSIFLNNIYYVKNIIFDHEGLSRMKILNDNTAQELNFKVTKFSIHVYEMIYGVYCEGTHPHISPIDQYFCMDPDLRYIPMTVESINNIEKMFGFLNLDESYLPTHQKEKIRRLMI